MHEFAVTEEISRIVLQTAEEASASRVTAVHLRVGTLTGIVDDSLRFYFDHLTRGTPAEGAALVVHLDEAVARCPRCGREQPMVPPLVLDCPICGGPLAVSGGRTLLVEKIEIDGPEPADPTPAPAATPEPYPGAAP